VFNHAPWETWDTKCKRWEKKLWGGGRIVPPAVGHAGAWPRGVDAVGDLC